MNNKYRLVSTTFDREKDEDKVQPQKIYFLSVEGNATEKEYFEGVSANRKQLGINAKVDVEVLKRGGKDTNSAPKHVIELLEEYIRLRELGKEELISEIPKDLVSKYGDDFILKYLNNPDDIQRKQRNAFVTDLMKIGYDIKYRKYLQKYDSNLDEFGILIDRDLHTHSEINMSDCIRYCKEKNYRCYIVNPCFEFWLLLHLSDVREEYKDNLDNIKQNPKLTGRHTFVSNEVSNKAHHGKSCINFKGNYMMNIDIAIERAKQFANDEDELVTNIGCNIWKLIVRMKEFQ